MATTQAVSGDVKDMGLAENGKRKIEWANQQMPVLQIIRKRFIKEQPLKGLVEFDFGDVRSAGARLERARDLHVLGVTRSDVSERDADRRVGLVELVDRPVDAGHPSPRT